MKSNPFADISYRQPVVATDFRFAGSRERAVGAGGELNASSRKDLLVQIAKFLEVSANQGIMTEETAYAQEDLAKRHKEAVEAAFKNDAAHRELGEVLAQELYQAGNREGFARRFMARLELSQGQIPQAKMRMKNLVATTATGPSKVQSQLIRDNLFFPPEFYITTRPFIEQREINQSNGDVLEEKYLEGLEGIMVAEDRTWLLMARAAIGMANNLTTIVGTFNPTALSALRNQVTRWNIPAASLLIANDIWNDITGDTGFQQIIDPVSKHELLLTGVLGTLLGMTVLSDAYRHPEHKVLTKGDIIIVGDPVNHGQYTDRGGVNSQPIDGSIEQIPGRGWMMTESVSMVVANPRSVAFGTRT